MRTKVHNWDDEIDGESEEEEIEGIVGGGVNDNLGKDDSGRWWEIDFDADASKCLSFGDREPKSAQNQKLTHLLKETNGIQHHRNPPLQLRKAISAFFFQNRPYAFETLPKSPMEANILRILRNEEEYQSDLTKELRWAVLELSRHVIISPSNQNTPFLAFGNKNFENRLQ
ncbi:hypothetical protein L3X38_010633 [Prunus dulcis]|uniref:Uncharacterized protein n=1 Tax=Prunus dulcis TaxID=3755 RepID=A0AAD4ZDH6_PRUDU|nr:hypothetical protein L3X38_010633 [Prunus dulcis]